MDRQGMEPLEVDRSKVEKSMKGKVGIEYGPQEDGTCCATLLYRTKADTWQQWMSAVGKDKDEAKEKVLARYKAIPDPEEINVD